LNVRDVLGGVAFAMMTAWIPALIIGVLVLLVLRIITVFSNGSAKGSWKADVHRSGKVSLAVFLVAFIPLAALGSFLNKGCSTSDLSEFMSPDGKHKLLVYNFDCGATTDFSFNVTLLGAKEELGRGGGDTLFYRDHTFPDCRPERQNFDVHWLGANEVQVRVSGINGAFTKSKDGVKVEFERLP
jgi:hypothetical protein